MFHMKGKMGLAQYILSLSRILWPTPTLLGQALLYNKNKQFPLGLDPEKG